MRVCDPIISAVAGHEKKQSKFDNLHFLRNDSSVDKYQKQRETQIDNMYELF